MENAKGAVTTLFYRLDCRAPFAEPDPIQREIEIGKFELKDEVLTIDIRVECKTIAEARRLASPLVKAWQLEAEICRHPLRGFRFAFWRAEIVGIVPKRAEHAPEPLEYEKDDEGQLVIEWRAYPPAPNTRFTPEVEAACSRYFKAALDIGEPIQSAAYYVLTIAERASRGRREAASDLRIDEAVLRKIGELTSTRGDNATARKAIGPAAIPLSEEEARWIDSAVRLLLLHIGVVEADGLPDRLEMSDLPDLGAQ